VIRRLEDATGVSVLAPGFPVELLDARPEAAGAEVVVRAGR
jgi:3-hydroxyisobutyrate dehydrogenase